MSTREPNAAADAANPYAASMAAPAPASRSAPPTLVSAIMTRHIISVTPDTPLRAIRELFHLHRIHHLPVIEHDKLVGIISDRDVLLAVSPLVDKPAATAHDLATLEKKAHQIMKRSLTTATPDMPIAEAGQIMLANNISSLPVIESVAGTPGGGGGGGRCVGIVTSHDFMKWCLQSGCPTAKAA